MTILGHIKNGKVELAHLIEAPDGTPVRVDVETATPNPFGGFRENASLEELAKRQGVKPIQSIEQLRGDWPAEDDIDEFLREVREMRK